MKQIMVVKRCGQNEHLKQGDKQKQIYILFSGVEDNTIVLGHTNELQNFF